MLLRRHNLLVTIPLIAELAKNEQCNNFQPAGRIRDITLACGSPSLNLRMQLPTVKILQFFNSPPSLPLHRRISPPPSFHQHLPTTESVAPSPHCPLTFCTNRPLAPKFITFCTLADCRGLCALTGLTPPSPIEAKSIKWCTVVKYG